MFARLKASMMPNQFDAIEDDGIPGLTDMIFSATLGLEINQALPRPHKFD